MKEMEELLLAGYGRKAEELYQYRALKLSGKLKKMRKQWNSDLYLPGKWKRLSR